MNARSRAAIFAALGAAFLLSGFSGQAFAQATPQGLGPDPAEARSLEEGGIPAEAELARAHVLSRIEADLAALETFRPGYGFWSHIFTIPDGSVAFGSAEDGRLLAVFPARGDWAWEARWEDPRLGTVLRGERLEIRLTQRREQVASLLEAEVGPVLHNATRGRFLLPNARRYGSLLQEWGRIYERFGVPSEIGLAQAVIESGLNGRIRSEAGALGLCQWLPRNWEKMKRLAPNVIEGYNQTTQAQYCAAYLTVLAVGYGSFIPALSEHHAGGTNVGRTLINGHRLGGENVRDSYFLGAEFSIDLRAISPRAYREVYGTYGPRSFRYAEMVFGNAANVARLQQERPQETIHAIRVRRSVPLSEITRRTGLSVDEVRRFNPALVRQVPAGADLYLPFHVEEFGPDVSFWHRPPSAEYASVLNEFVRLETTAEPWRDPSFLPTLRDFRRRFRETGTHEGAVMAAVLAYVTEELQTSRRTEILADFQTSDRIWRLFQQGRLEWEAARSASAVAR